MRTKIKILILCMVCLAVCVSGCQKMESPVKGEINQEAVTVEFPEYYEKAYDKLNFKTVIVVPEKADVNGLERFTAKRAGYDMNSAYDAFFKDRRSRRNPRRGCSPGTMGKCLNPNIMLAQIRSIFTLTGNH